MRYSWKMNPTVLGLTVLTVSPGISGIGSNGGNVSSKQQARAITETVLIGLTASYLTKSYWPLIGPLAYAAFDYAWSESHDLTPEIGDSNGY